MITEPKEDSTSQVLPVALAAALESAAGVTTSTVPERLLLSPSSQTEMPIADSGMSMG